MANMSFGVNILPKYDNTSGNSQNRQELGSTTHPWKIIAPDIINPSISGATLTGTPTAPTAAANTNNDQIATTAYVMSAFKANDAMEFKGIINSNSDLPANHTHGWTYKIGTAGTYVNQLCEVGDMVICITDGTSANDAHWAVIQTNIDSAAKADKTDTILETTLSRGRKENTTVGTGSIAFGNNVQASGVYSQAFGDNTSALSNYCHVEGSDTKAASSCGHAEGGNTLAGGSFTHAEGLYTVAMGSCSHAEGYYTLAEGSRSHAEGRYTVAYGTSMHACGEYNVNKGISSLNEWTEGTVYHMGDKVKRTSDERIKGYECKATNSSTTWQSAEWKDYTVRLTDLEVVGNGTDSTRSNARLLDWSGNEYLKGDLYVNCEADSSNGSKVAKITEVNVKADKVIDATYGNFAALDANGNLFDSGYKPSDYNGKLNIPTGNASNGQVLVYDGSGGTRCVTMSGTGEIPVATSSTLGAVKVDSTYGVQILNSDTLAILKATDAEIKAGTNTYRVITPSNQHTAIFYGLAKVAGVDMNYSSNNVGVYTDNAASAIRTMFGAASKADPEFYGTLSCGRTSESTIGTGSFAFGNSVIAAQNYSFAIGESTVASGICSYAEGIGTQAQANYSHAEGYYTNVQATGTNAHAEGQYTIASNSNAHAEGYETEASGTGSHAEGYGSVAASPYSHAEGYYVQAMGKSQHCFGEFNVLRSSVATARDTYVEVVGNGSSTNMRSNARALDWYGNEYLKGTLYVYCNANSTSGSEISTKSYVNQKVINCSSAISIPTTGTDTYLIEGLTEDYILILWNFSTSAENNPPVSLSWETDTDSFMITNNSGIACAETVKPIFIHKGLTQTATYLTSSGAGE